MMQTYDIRKHLNTMFGNKGAVSSMNYLFEWGQGKLLYQSCGDVLIFTIIL